MKNVIKIVSLLSIILIAFIVILKNTSGLSEKKQSINEEKIPSSITIVMANKVNNEEDKDKLITETFHEGELRSNSDEFINKDKFSFDEVEQKYKIQCLRMVGNYYYSIHKSHKGGYLYVLYQYDKKSGKLKAVDKAFIYKALKKEDFKELKVGQSTLEDVVKIDSEIDSMMVEGGESSHTLVDGSVVTIKYTNIERHYVVTDITYEKPKSTSVLKVVLSKDLPNTSEKKIDETKIKESTRNLLKKVNNEKDKDILITKKIDNKNIRQDPPEILFYNQSILDGMSMEEINKIFEVECLRKVEDCFYSINKSAEGGYLYLLYEYNVNRNEFIVVNGTYLYKNINFKDFEAIKEGQSSFDDVLKIVPKAYAIAKSYGFESVIRVSDGGLIRLRYKRNGESMKVEQMVYRPYVSSKNVLRYVLHTDLPS